MSDDTITLALHGLKADNELVRADVFAKKLNAFVQGLIAADKMANNGEQLHTFVVDDLIKSSAIAVVREKQRKQKRPRASAVQAWDRFARVVYNGEAAARELDTRFLRSVKALSAGTEKVFDHAEVGLGKKPEAAKILRIDDYFQGRSVEALKAVDADIPPPPKAYRGVATGSFDGTLQVMDSRGQVLRAKLLTTAGKNTIDCVVPKEQTQVLASAFDQRVRVEGVAHYDGARLLPVRLDVRRIVPVKVNADLRPWRGAFRVSEEAVNW